MPQPFTTVVTALASRVTGPAAPMAQRYRNTLLGKIGWPNPAGAPQIDLIQVTLDQPKAQFTAATNVITVKHAAQATPVEVLDAILYEAANALNPGIAAAAGMPKITPVGQVAAATATAEFTTFKNYVIDLIAILLPGPGLAGLNPGFVTAQAGLGLPSQAQKTLTGWQTAYMPLYTAAAPPIPAGLVAPAPMPAPVPVGGVLAANARDALAVMLFTNSIHDPHATGVDAHLATLTTFQLYYFDRVKGFSRTEFLQNIANNYPAGNNAATLYGSEWSRASLSKNGKVGLYACLMANLRRTAGAPPVPAQLLLPAAANNLGMKELADWMNSNDNVPTVVNAFKQDLVRGLILDLAPRTLGRHWHNRAA